ncbi:hypothetical protein E4U13_005698 [Claviceps humidiphila]|uniref:Uncharacterized protein n=1 Tax=Claviceps humidiphila TaxID=1294629 RepID=A0A9P7Q804_9HYPO|nr:hypothetical protein E4U13_005698 [Claviceps humidiphila]
MPDRGAGARAFGKPEAVHPSLILARLCSAWRQPTGQLPKTAHVIITGQPCARSMSIQVLGVARWLLTRPHARNLSPSLYSVQSRYGPTRLRLSSLRCSGPARSSTTSLEFVPANSLNRLNSQPPAPQHTP